MNTFQWIQTIAGWILAVFLALAFIFFGGVKLAGHPGMVEEFARIGAGQWLRFVTGFLEVSGAIGVLIPRVRFWAALQIASVMAGATLTNIFVLRIPVLARLTAVLMSLALALAWLRRR
jgi:uncharacterized membrane protein YphA (DoxX/SURF4 family)